MSPAASIVTNVTDLQRGLWDEVVELPSDSLADSDHHPMESSIAAQSDVYLPVPTSLDSVEVRRSARRKRSVIAFRDGDRTVVVAPQRMSQRDIDTYVRELIGRLDARDQRGAAQDALMLRAERLVASYFDHDVIAEHSVPVTIRWVTNQSTRWGSCTPADGAIRLSHRLTHMPDYVIDSVLMHELVHLVVSDHGERFNELMERFPDLDRANAFLAGYTLGEQRSG
jgi:predicted metal-dependent hydrolase